jgi:hypothetical protein
MRVNTRRAGDIGSDLPARNADPLIDPKDSLFDLHDSAVHGTSNSMSSSTRGWAGDLDGCKARMQTPWTVREEFVRVISYLHAAARSSSGSGVTDV